MAEATKYIDLNEFRDLGFLQEVNRLFFNPLGLALGLLINDDDKVVKIGGIWDYRDDPEGVVFNDLEGESRTKATYVQQELEKHKEARIALFGNIIQPIK